MRDLSKHPEIDLKNYSDQAKTHDYLDNLTEIESTDAEQLLNVGVDREEKERSATFIQKDNSIVHCKTCQDGIEILGINLDEDTARMTAYLDQQRLPWTTLHASGAGWEHPMAVRYGIKSIPAMFLVGKDGKVVSIDARGERLHTLLEELLGDQEGG